MIVTCVHVFVKPEHVEDFIAASKQNHENSVQEPGNRRFDVLQSTEDPTRFLLYEAYDDYWDFSLYSEKRGYQNDIFEISLDAAEWYAECSPRRLTLPAGSHTSHDMTCERPISSTSSAQRRIVAAFRAIRRIPR